MLYPATNITLRVKRLLLYLIVLTLIIFPFDFPDLLKLEVIASTPIDRKFLTVIENSIIDDDMELFNKLMFEQIHDAEISYDQKRILEAYLFYLEHIPSDYRDPTLKEVLSKAINLSAVIEDDSLKFRSWITFCFVFDQLSESNKSYQFASKALSYSSISGDLEQKIMANLCMGASLLGLDDIVESYQNYLNAKFLITQLEDEKLKLELQKKWCNHIYLFHNALGNYDEAIFYKVQELKLYENGESIDSLELMWLYYDIAFSITQSGKKFPIHLSLINILCFSERNNYTRLKNYIHALYRKHLIDKNDFEEFYNFYTHRVPQELERIKIQNPAQYNVFKAYFNEYKGNIDSAAHYFTTAEQLVATNNNVFFQSNFYKRQGEFFYRHDMKINARKAYLKSMELSKEVGYFAQVQAIAKVLELIAAELGYFEEAYSYQNLYNELHLQSIEKSHSNTLLNMELKNQEKEQEYLQARQAKEINRLYSTQFFSIAIGVVILMIFVAVVGSTKVPHWLIEMLVFFTIICIFEIIILYLDHEFYKITSGEPWKMFSIKVFIISFLYPLHYVIEHKLTDYLSRNDLIKKPTTHGLRKYLASLWPWLVSNDSNLDNSSHSH